jgi:benzoyl-CoA reductase/2-hydroxyglutaryl-CoA dehydratase subunit BcrC/BadD/HgdB
MNKTVIGTCDECKFYIECPTDGLGRYWCSHVKIDYDLKMSRYHREGDTFSLIDEGDDRLTYYDYEGYDASHTVGPKFGCIHWEAK